MANEELLITPSSEGFVLTKIDPDGSKSKLTLTESNLAALSRLSANQIERLLAERGRPDAGVSAVLAVPVKGYRANPDIHGQEVLLRLQDVAGGQFDFSLTHNGSLLLAKELLEAAKQLTSPQKKTHQ